MNTISDIAVLLRNGKSVRQSADADGLPITRIETIADGTINPKRVGYADLSETDAEGWLLEKGDILISHINSTKHLGKCAIYDGRPSKLVHGMNLLNLRLDKSETSPHYIYRVLSSAAFRRLLPRITKDSVNQSSFNISNFQKLQIPLPPLTEQKRIAGILDAADALRAKRRESLAQLDTLLQSTFLEMFGDPVTNPKGWQQTTLGSLIEPGDKINYGVVQPGDDTPSGRPLIRVGDFVKGNLNLGGLKLIAPEIEKKYQRSRLNGTELLVSCVGSIGTVCKVPAEAKDVNIARAVSRVPLRKEISRDFMLYCLRSDAVQRHFFKETRTVSQPTLNISLIKTAPVFQPPLNLQRRFAAIVESIEKQKTRQRTHLAELDTLFASLQSRAFNGEL